jgi:hypothetical protein
MINSADLKWLLPYFPSCHVCNTPYDTERLHYALTLLIAACTSPATTGGVGEEFLAGVAQPSQTPDASESGSGMSSAFGVNPDQGQGQQVVQMPTQSSGNGQFDYGFAYQSQSPQQQFS